VNDLPRSLGAITGDLFAAIESDRNAQRPSDLALIEHGRTIADTRPKGDDVSFMHSIMCQVGLPRAKIAGDRFERANGASALEVRAGSLWNGTAMVPQFVPYGTIPRLILAYISTYAVRHRTAEIPFGDSVNEALRFLGIEKGGQSYAMFRRQVSALAACTITIGFNAGDIAYTFNGSPISRFSAWLPGQEGQQSLWPSHLMLGAEFYETLIEHAVPSDLRALSKLGKSALAMDVYLFLVARLHRTHRPTKIYWHQLQAQFGQEYVGTHAANDFKQAFKKALSQACSVYPDAKVEPVHGGIELRPSREAVDPKEVKRLRVAGSLR
jgi:hypothetical protein